MVLVPIWDWTNVDVPPPEITEPPENVTGARFPLDGTDEEVAIWLTICAEFIYVNAGVLPSEIADLTRLYPSVNPIVDANDVEILLGSPAVLWADFAFRHTPEPDGGTMQSVASWIWGCEPEIPTLPAPPASGE